MEEVLGSGVICGVKVDIVRIRGENIVKLNGEYCGTFKRGGCLADWIKAGGWEKI